MDWQHDTRPPYGDTSAVYQVWTTDGQVRTVRRLDASFHGFRFLDCRHPMAQAYLEERKVVAWRPVEAVAL